LYSNYFKTKETKTENIVDIKTEETKEWANYGKKKAEEFASMNYDEFANRIIDELRLGISYTPNIIFIIFCVAGVVSSFLIIAKISVAFGLLILVISGTVCYFLFERARIDYIAERRHKILNKYK
jgi:Flp pilus assembly protein TadB